MIRLLSEPLCSVLDLFVIGLIIASLNDNNYLFAIAALVIGSWVGGVIDRLHEANSKIIIEDLFGGEK